jgi:hypothetical protein
MSNGKLLLERVSNDVEKALTHSWDIEPGTLLGDLVAVTTRLQTQMAALDCQVVEAYDESGAWAEVDSGDGAEKSTHANCAAVMNTKVFNRHPKAAQRRVAMRRRLNQMPHVDAAFEAGSISEDHVRVFGECLAKRFEGLFAEHEETLVQAAIDLDWKRFRRLIEHWRNAADRSESDLKDKKDHDARSIMLSMSFMQRGVLTGTLTKEVHQLAVAEFERIAQKLFEQDWAEATERLGEGNVSPGALCRTPAQRRHDAFAVILLNSAAYGDGDARGPRINLFLHTTAADLEAALDAEAGIEPGPGMDLYRIKNSMIEFEDETQMSPNQLVSYAIRGHVRRVVWSPEGEVIDYGRDIRFFSKAQKEAMAVRDSWCACGCGTPARRCDADHRIEWRNYGPSDLRNADPLCRGSHTNKTALNNRATATRPDSRRYPRPGSGRQPPTSRDGPGGTDPPA